MAYGYITLGQLRAALMQRLQDQNNIATPVAEANLYLNEALRILNAQIGIWNTDYQFNFNPGDTWKSLNVMGSPRQRTVTDDYLYQQMEAMLGEPTTGGTWTGTDQFNITQLSQALQYRRDELLLISAANTVNLIQVSPANSTRSNLPDTALDLFRVRWIPVQPSFVAPYALGREDVVARNAWQDYGPATIGPPDSWMITSNQPLQFDVSNPPNVPGMFDMLYASSGAAFNPPAATPVGLPDDWTWVALYGALADVLGTSPESRDVARAKYCQQRYEQGKQAMIKLPWLVDAAIEKLPVKPLSYLEMDSWGQNWELTWPAGDPQIVVGGVDYVALAPNPASTTVSSVLTVIGNAPIPVNDSSQIQLDRAGVDAVLNYAQHIATFKFSGKDFTDTVPLLNQFESYCRMKNEQYAALGIYRDQMELQGNTRDYVDPRFEEGQHASAR